MKKFAALCDTSTIFNYPPIISILAALGLNENNFKTLPIKGSLQLFCSSCDEYQGIGNVTELLEKNNIIFDSLYCGNFNSEDDLMTVLDFLDKFTDSHTKLVVNPVMKEGCSPRFIELMKTLISRATIITPTYDESITLLNKEKSKISKTPYEELKTWVRELSCLGPKDILITDVPEGEGKNDTIVFSYDKDTSAYWVIPSCYKKDAKFNFVDVLTNLIIKDTDLTSAMDTFL